MANIKPIKKTPMPKKKSNPKLRKKLIGGDHTKIIGGLAPFGTPGTKAA
tara:strand:- start:320 stop:466 length:147 start_codon:yes stop_codon:yes gene_type:complete